MCEALRGEVWRGEVQRSSEKFGEEISPFANTADEERFKCGIVAHKKVSIHSYGAIRF